MTGKTSLLRELQVHLYIDLLDPEIELQLKKTPRLFWEQISFLKTGALIVIDEVQRVPVLLDYVQKGITGFIIQRENYLFYQRATDYFLKKNLLPTRTQIRKFDIQTSEAD